MGGSGVISLEESTPQGELDQLETRDPLGGSLLGTSLGHSLLTRKWNWRRGWISTRLEQVLGVTSVCSFDTSPLEFNSGVSRKHHAYLKTEITFSKQPFILVSWMLTFGGVYNFVCFVVNRPKYGWKGCRGEKPWMVKKIPQVVPWDSKSVQIYPSHGVLGFTCKTRSNRDGGTPKTT